MKNLFLLLTLSALVSPDTLAGTTTGKGTDSRDWAACSVAFYQAFTPLMKNLPSSYQVKIDSIQYDSQTRRHNCSLSLTTDSEAPPVRVNQQVSWVDAGQYRQASTLEKACFDAEVRTFSESLRMNYNNGAGFFTMDYSVLKDRVYEQVNELVGCTVTRKMRKSLLWKLQNITTTSTAGSSVAESCALAKATAVTQGKEFCVTLGLNFIGMQDERTSPASFTASANDGWKCDYNGNAYCHE